MTIFKRLAISTTIILICTISASAQETFSTDGTLVVLNKSDDTVTLLALKTGKTVLTLPTGNSPHEGTISPDGRTLVVSNYGSRNPSTLTVIDLEKKKVTKTIGLEKNIAPHGIAFLPDGERVIVSTEASNTVTIVNIKTGQVEKSISTEPLGCHMVVITPSGDKIFASSIGSGMVSVIDVKKGQQIKTIKTGAGAEGMDISPDGKELWVGNRSADTISVIDTNTLEIVATLKSKSFPIRVKFTPDGKHVLVSNMQSQDVSVFDAKSRKEIHRIPMFNKAVDKRSKSFFSTARRPAPIGILIHPNNQYAFIANTRADMVSVIDLNQWQVITRLKAGREPDGMALIFFRGRYNR